MIKKVSSTAEGLRSQHAPNLASLLFVSMPATLINWLLIPLPGNKLALTALLARCPAEEDEEGIP